MIYGVDVSGWQDANGPFDFVAAAAQLRSTHSDCTGLIACIKATEGNGAEMGSFVRQWSDAKAAGFQRVAYCFAHPSNDPHSEAAFLLSVVKPVLEAGDGIAIDLEVVDGNPSNLAEWLVECSSDVAAVVTADHTYDYASLAFINEHLQDARLAQYRLWLAEWNNNSKPDVPAPWKFVSIWQYADDGNFKGVTTDLDVELNAPAPSPAPVPDPQPAPHPAPAPAPHPTGHNPSQPTWYGPGNGTTFKTGHVVAPVAHRLGWSGDGSDYSAGPLDPYGSALNHGETLTLDASIVHDGVLYYHINGGQEGWVTAASLHVQ